MIRILIALSLLFSLSACLDGAQPFDAAAVDETEDAAETDDAITGGGLEGTATLPPGTAEPSSSSRIERYETGGLVQTATYNAVDDTFEVDNLAFDGENVYQRDDQVPTLGTFAVYEADAVTLDSLTGTAIPQITPYRLIYGASTNLEDGNRRTSFAIVRTGGYSGYGFGGFVYQREGGVVIPTTGQAVFNGNYAGTRVFNGAGGLEYTRGDVRIAIDFDDFNDNAGVYGTVFNREAFETDGTPISLGGADELVLPNIQFVIVEGAETVTANGEITGTLNNSIVVDGTLQEYESGSYYGIIAGDMADAGDGGEIVGMFVVESTDPRYEDITAQETGGFILYR